MENISHLNDHLIQFETRLKLLKKQQMQQYIQLSKTKDILEEFITKTTNLKTEIERKKKYFNQIISNKNEKEVILAFIDAIIIEFKSILNNIPHEK